MGRGKFCAENTRTDRIRCSATSSPTKSTYAISGLGDPYDAVRLISERSLRTIPEWSQFEVDVIGPPEIRAGIIGAAMGRLEKTLTGVPRPAVLFDENPQFNTNGAVELIQRRENRDVMLLE